MLNLQPLKRSSAQRHVALVDFFRAYFAGYVGLDHDVVLIDEHSQVIPNACQCILRRRLGNLLDPLYFFVVLLLLFY